MGAGGGKMRRIGGLLALAMFGLLLLLPAVILLALGGFWLRLLGLLALACWLLPAFWVLKAWLTWRRHEDDYV